MTDEELELLEDLVLAHNRTDNKGVGRASQIVAYSALKKIQRLRYQKV